MHPYRQLEVWQRARAMCLEVYRLTADYPRAEQFGLTIQLRRAAISVGANIVKGTKRQTAREFARFLNIAEGSAAEAAYLLGLGADLGYGQRDGATAIAREFERLERMLCALRKQVAASHSRNQGR